MLNYNLQIAFNALSNKIDFKTIKPIHLNNSKL